VEKVNGKPIRNLQALAEALAEKPEQNVIDFEGIGRPLVLQRADVENARDRIRKRYNVLNEQFLGRSATSN
jgi:hypothetical protein